MVRRPRRRRARSWRQTASFGSARARCESCSRPFTRMVEATLSGASVQSAAALRRGRRGVPSGCCFLGIARHRRPQRT
eukprot:4402044-Prymnesium_polylepis.3